MTDYYFSSDELSEMRTAQVGHMLDECVILAYAEGTRNEFNEADEPTYTAGDPLPCGVDMRSGSERGGFQMTQIQYDATLRLPIKTVIKEKDRVQIIARFGEYIDPITFDIVSPAQRGPSGIRILLRKAVV